MKYGCNAKNNSGLHRAGFFSAPPLVVAGALTFLLCFGMRVASAQTTFAIQTSNGHFLTAVGGGGLGGSITSGGSAPIDSNRTVAQGWEIFTIVPIGNNQVAIQTSDGKYLTANQGGGIRGTDDNASPIDTDRTAVNTWETFTINYVDSSHTKATIQTWDGHYLTANYGGGINTPLASYPLRSNATQIQTWERFTLVPVYTSIQFNIGTGSDNARSDAVIFANMTGQYSPFCLKPTDTLTAFQFCFTSSKPAPTWNSPSMQTPMVFPLNPPILSTMVQGNFAQLQIGYASYQGGCGGLCYESYDNWNMSQLRVALLNAAGPQAARSATIVATVLDVYDRGQNCYARFTTIGPSTAEFKSFQLNPTPSNRPASEWGYMITTPSWC